MAPKAKVTRGAAALRRHAAAPRTDGACEGSGREIVARGVPSPVTVRCPACRQIYLIKTTDRGNGKLPEHKPMTLDDLRGAMGAPKP